jgi:hypothetical protein
VPIPAGTDRRPEVVIHLGGRQAGLEEPGRLSDGLGRGVPGDLGELAVDVLDDAAGIGDEHGRRALLHREREPFQPHGGALPLDRVPNHAGQQRTREPGFHQAVLRSRAHRGQRIVLAAGFGEHDDGLVRHPAAGALEQLRPGIPADIEQNRIHGPRPLPRPILPVHPLQLESLGKRIPEQGPDHPRVRRVVDDEQDAQWGAGLGRAQRITGNGRIDQAEAF